VVFIGFLIAVWRSSGDLGANVSLVAYRCGGSSRDAVIEDLGGCRKVAVARALCSASCIEASIPPSLTY
jgi:hypothetical protein